MWREAAIVRLDYRGGFGGLERLYHYREGFPTIGGGSAASTPPLNWSDTPTVPSPDSGLLLFSGIY